MQSRKNRKLKDYSYSTRGGYFVTICTFNKEKFFGEIVRHKVSLSDIGIVARDFWRNIPVHYQHTELDEFIVMPDHIHGIIIIKDQDRSGVRSNTATIKNRKQNYYSQISPLSGSLSDIIRNYKAAVTRWCNRHGHQEFRWQPNYYDHIIRNDHDLAEIRMYIQNNPRISLNDLT